jgi:hypothetical protein
MFSQVGVGISSPARNSAAEQSPVWNCAWLVAASQRVIVKLGLPFWMSTYTAIGWAARVGREDETGGDARATREIHTHPGRWPEPATAEIRIAAAG